MGGPVIRTAAAALFATTLVAPQVFHGEADLVLLNVSAMDGRGHAVGGLTKDDFVVFEDGLPQDVTIFLRDPQPIALSLLVDTSVSMDPKMPVTRQAASGFVKRLGPQDIAQIITFATTARIAQTFTGERQKLLAGIDRIEAGGRTSLYDAVYIALDELNRAPKPAPDARRRQAIVLLSDGEDTSSHKDFEDVRDLSRRSDVIVFAIGLRAKGETPQSGWNEADFVLRTLAQETGGHAFFATSPDGLPAIYTQIADELQAQYTIGYRSKNQKHDGLWRKVAVQVTHPGTMAHTKSGYYAPARER
jgi:Ca-activated chloride channel family protein